MDKAHKLRRYGRKDYSLLVDFPVEIVGRDGVVRYYTFEESVHLYQRRIASAPTRYTDRDVADAEVAHCRRRIEQLRRSYFARYGWFDIHVPAGARPVEQGLAGEVAAFLRRCAEGTELDPESLRVTLLAEEEPYIFYVERALDAEGMSGPFLLYLYHFGEGEEGAARDAFFEFLKILQTVRQVPEGVETLVAFHHTADCGLVLTGRPEDVSSGDHPGLMRIAEIPALIYEGYHGDDPLRDAARLLRAGRRREALESYLALYQQNPWRRQAAVAAAAIADSLSLFRDAETVTVMAQRYFPDDADVAYQLGLARLRLGDIDGVEGALAHVLATSWPARLLYGLAALRAGRPVPSLIRLFRLGPSTGVGAELLASARWARGRLLIWLALRFLVGAAVAMAGLAFVGDLWVALVATGLALLVWVGIDALTHRRLVRVLCDPARMPIHRVSEIPRAGDQMVTREI